MSGESNGGSALHGLNRIRRPGGPVLAQYMDGVSYSWPRGNAPAGLVVLERSEDGGKTWTEFLRGEWITEMTPVSRFVPA